MGRVTLCGAGTLLTVLVGRHQLYPGKNIEFWFSVCYMCPNLYVLLHHCCRSACVLVSVLTLALRCSRWTIAGSDWVRGTIMAGTHPFAPRRFSRTPCQLARMPVTPLIMCYVCGVAEQCSLSSGAIACRSDSGS